MSEIRKYLVSVPVLARVEVYVDATSEKKAMELAMVKADCNKEDINHETMVVLDCDGTIDEVTSELIEFGISQGYQVWDYKKEFGE